MRHSTRTPCRTSPRRQTSRGPPMGAKPIGSSTRSRMIPHVTTHAAALCHRLPVSTLGKSFPPFAPPFSQWEGWCSLPHVGVSSGQHHNTCPLPQAALNATRQCQEPCPPCVGCWRLNDFAKATQGHRWQREDLHPALQSPKGMPQPPALPAPFMPAAKQHQSPPRRARR